MLKISSYLDNLEILKSARNVLMVNNIKLEDANNVGLKSLILAHALYPNRLFSMTRGKVQKNAKLDVDFCEADSSLCEGNKSIKREDMPVIEGGNLQKILKNFKKGFIDWLNPPENADQIWYVPVDELDGKLLQVSKNQVARLGLKNVFKYHERSSNGDMKITYRQVYLNAGLLKPTQSEINFEKSFGMAKDYLGGGFDELVSYDPNNVTLVSKEGYIIDGHHRWASIGLLNTYDPKSFSGSLLNLVTEENSAGVKKWLKENKGAGSNIKIPVVWVDLPLKDLLPCLNACTDSLGVKRKKFKS